METTYALSRPLTDGELRKVSAELISEGWTTRAAKQHDGAKLSIELDGVKYKTGSTKAFERFLDEVLEEHARDAYAQ